MSDAELVLSVSRSGGRQRRRRVRIGLPIQRTSRAVWPPARGVVARLARAIRDARVRARARGAAISFRAQRHPLDSVRHGALGVIAASALACAPLNLAGDGVETPGSASPSVVSGEIIELSNGLSRARIEHEASLLAPRSFAHAAAARDRARALQGEGDHSTALTAVSQGRAALGLAIEASREARKRFEEILTRRMRALRAGAALLGPDFESAELELKRAAGALEANGQFDEREKLVAAYRALELRAIKERTIGDARRTLERARAAGAARNVPQAHAIATEQLERVERFIERRRDADEAMRERAEDARFHVLRVVALNDAVEAMTRRAPEELVLAYEGRLRALGEALGLPDRRDWSFAERWTELELAITSLRSDRAFLVAGNRSLRSKLEAAHDRIETLTGENDRLAREQAFDRLFEESRREFSPEEAEVYRQGSDLIMRLRGLDFRAGDVALLPDGHALLAKVQRVIRRFGTPGVTVEGHTDSTGGPALNERLSQERAEVVRRYLVDNEVVPPHRVMAVGRGAEDPLAPNDTPEGRRLNRRIDIVIDTREVFLIAGTKRILPGEDRRRAEPLIDNRATSVRNGLQAGR